MATYEKSHHLRSLVFDTGEMQDFDNIAAVAAAAANTTVQARLPIPQRCKIYKVVANFSAIGSGGTHSFNIVVGNGAEVGVGQTDVIATAGTTVFTTDQVLSGGAADVPQVFNVSGAIGNFDVIYDTGTLLTVRVVTPASTGSFTNLKVVIFAKCIDAHPAATMLSNSDGTVGFSPAAF